MPKVSVIVPVYNVETYLPACMESILSQTLEDLEIICVDDGSTDGSGKLLDAWAAGDSRIRVFHEVNRGYGAAMNRGLDAATGEYIGIVESDDCICARMYETLYDNAVHDQLDLVKSDAFYWLENLGYKRKIHYSWLDPYYDRVLSETDRNRFFDFYMNIWTGIYKRDFLVQNKIRFHESPGASYQDNGFWMQTLFYCQRAKWLSQAFYLYRQDNPAASVKSRGRLAVMREEYRFLIRTLWDRADYQFLPYCYYYRMLRHRGTFMRIADDLKREFCRQIIEDYKKYKGYIKWNMGLDTWFYSIAADPDGVCRKLIQRKRELKERLECAPYIIVYGTGRRGDITFRGLYNEGYYDKLYFAISQEPSCREMAGRPYLSIVEAHSLCPGALVILGVQRGTAIYREMEGILTQLGMECAIDSQDIEENIYIL